MLKETVSTAGACQALGIGKTKLFELLATAQLGRVKCGRKTLVTVESIKAYVRTNLVNGN